MKNKKIIGALAVTIGIVAISTVIFTNNNKSAVSESIGEFVTAVEIYNIENSHIEKYKKFSGIVGAGEKEVVTPKTVANITSIKVKEGDYVKKGQALMTLDSSKLDEQISELDKANGEIQAGINESKAKLDELKTKSNELLNKKMNLETEIKTLEEANVKAEVDLLEIQGKVDSGEITLEEFELKKKEIETLKTQNIAKISKNKVEIKTLEATKEALDKSITELEGMFNNSSGSNEISGMLNGLKDKKGNYTVVAGISGVIKELNLKVGQMPVSFTKPGILIENTNSVDFEFQIMKEDIDKFKIGMELDIYIDIDEKEEKRKVKIESIAAEEDERTKQYNVVATMQNPNNEIKIGSFAKIMLGTEIKEDVITIPKDALMREEGKNFVYVNKDNIAKKVEVVTGIENHNQVEIQSGLSLGDKVVVKGKEFIEQDGKINIVKEVKLNEDN